MFAVSSEHFWSIESSGATTRTGYQVWVGDIFTSTTVLIGTIDASNSGRGNCSTAIAGGRKVVADGETAHAMRAADISRPGIGLRNRAATAWKQAEVVTKLSRDTCAANASQRIDTLARVCKHRGRRQADRESGSRRCAREQEHTTVMKDDLGTHTHTHNRKNSHRYMPKCRRERLVNRHVDGCKILCRLARNRSTGQVYGRKACLSASVALARTADGARRNALRGTGWSN